MGVCVEHRESRIPPLPSLALPTPHLPPPTPPQTLQTPQSFEEATGNTHRRPICLGLCGPRPTPPTHIMTFTLAIPPPPQNTHTQPMASISHPPLYELHLMWQSPLPDPPPYPLPLTSPLYPPFST